MNNIMTPHGAGRATPESGEAPSRDESAQGFKGQESKNRTDCAESADYCKRVATATALCAMRGIQLHLLNSGAFLATGSGMVVHFTELEEVRAWLRAQGVK